MSDYSPEAGSSALTTAAAVHCPYCSELIDLVVDLSVDAQTYVEDCQVCCRPIVVSYGAEGGQLTYLDVRQENE